ncbi:hypothetical protein [Corynebacterium variabile]|uniref:hypothetical protein n=1 Tax=Corynebacterium variabile TaxID=1727 RepID=UPI003BB095BB
MTAMISPRSSLAVGVLVAAVALSSCSEQDTATDTRAAEPTVTTVTVAPGETGFVVPTMFTTPLKQAGDTCESVSPDLLAAVMHTDTNFYTQASSAGGAVLGPAAFTTAAWEQFGDGPATQRTNPKAATTALAAQLCDYAATAETGRADHDWTGSTQDIALSIRNAGLAAVEAAHGVPDTPEVIDHLDAINTALHPAT